ncbi:hypothetical protein [Halostella pelagica]|uniref:hypothetical protein n=1 Tax=Halostella pelagica TaxID=2583824 RepID=UPI001080B4F2|nr:hypothetical protein [Halostella pelagica]
MTTATSPTPENVECGQCDDHFQPHASVKGSYCSRACYHKDKGNNALAQIQNDHRFCSTCFRQVKTVARPDDDQLRDIGVPKTIRETFAGYQYSTDATVFGEDIRPSERHESPARQKTRRSWGCQCGAIDLRGRDRTLESVEGGAVLLNLLRCLATLYQDEAIAHAPSLEALFDGVRESGDLEQAIGRSLYGSA